MSSAESERLVSLIKNAIRLSNYTYRDIERQLGWRVGTITRLMRGGLGLKVEHLLSILLVLDFSPGRFFAAAFPTSEKAGAAEDRLFRLLEQMYGDPDALRAAGARQGRGPTTQDEIDEMVRVSLRKIIGATGAAAEPQPG
jgi:transcriptional regulator with XRE-family HTH domain